MREKHTPSKAIAGAVLAVVSATTGVAADGAVSGWDWLIIVGAAAAGYLGVYVAPRNRPRRRRRP